MVHLINKDIVAAEIKRRKKKWSCGSSIEAKYKVGAYKELIEWLDTLEVKEVDLGKAYDDFLESRKKKGYMLFEVAKYFFELGLSVNSPVTAAESIERHLQESTIVYVVTRSEEHADYVEEVFFDENKAKEYCDQFNGDENEYVRHITKVKVTL